MKRLSLIFVFLLIAISLFAQRRRPENLPKLDSQVAHFGYSLGLNSMGFTIRPSADFSLMDTVWAIETGHYIGFNINIIANLRLAEYLDLRFMPGLMFGQRDMEYKLRENDKFRRHTMMIESTFLDFPLLLKYKSMRWNNFRPYLIGGGSYRVDLAAQRKVDPSEFPKIRLKPMDLYYEIGVGTDFFLEYFMFGIELKGSFGIFNLVKYDHSEITQAYSRLNSKMIVLSFHFEGGKIDKIKWWD
ncbi:MAG: PorT family protein [Bacteroidales bacterium]|nr:PorT family protein [Bacteroidales bacterium]